MRTRIRPALLAWLLVCCPALFTACDRDRNAKTADAPPAAAAAPASEVRHLDPAGAERFLAENPQAIVLDVRTPAEFSAGHISGATNVDFNASGFAAALAALDRNRTYLVHCAAGGRSTKSLETLRQLGFRTVAHLDGGLNAWTKAGKPVVK